MERTYIAYFLIFLLGVGAAAVFLYLRHNSYARTDKRRRLRERKAFTARMEAKAAKEMQGGASDDPQ